MNNDFPELIGKYKIQGIIAKGGMGVVYKALHPSLKRFVVIKKMTARGKSGNAERFKKEAQILLDLQSPYIVHLFDYFTEAGYRYMVEELVDGIALDKLLEKQSSLPCPVAMLLMQDACYALKYAHSKDIVHRDIKPGNILISKRGEIKLADFGIASDTAEGDKITQTGVALGTPAYMPPEQFEDSSKVDKRADIYALGIMLYEMLTGTKPYPGTFSIETLNTIKKGKYIKPQKIDKTIPKPICRLIHKMIRPKPQKRYQSVEGILKVIKKYLSHYDTHEIRVQLAKSVFKTEQYSFPPIIAKDKKIRKIRSTLVSLVICVVVFFSCWNMGLIHKYVLKRWYSSVSVKMIMPRSLSDNMDLPARAFFFENDSDTIPEIKGTRRNFVQLGSGKFDNLFSFKQGLQVERPASKNKTYVMKNVYLKNGEYRVKVVVGPYVWWKSFTIQGDDLEITCDFLKNTTRNIKFTTYAYDSKTNKNISDNASFEIFYEGKWIELKNISPQNFNSGAVWKIRVRSEGYQEEIFSLLVDWFQDEVIISCALNEN